MRVLFFYLGAIQDPRESRIGLTQTDPRTWARCVHSEFSIQDPASQYFGRSRWNIFSLIRFDFILGYLDFPFKLSQDCVEKSFLFVYGSSGYLPATLFHIDKKFIEKYKLTHLFSSFFSRWRHFYTSTAQEGIYVLGGSSSDRKQFHINHERTTKFYFYFSFQFFRLW